MAISGTAKAAMFSQQTEEFYIALLTVAIAGGDTYRFSDNPTVRASDDPLLYATISRGNAYYFIPFTVLLPDASEDSPMTSRIVLENISRQFIPLLRTVPETARWTIELVLASTPDVVEIVSPDMQLHHIHYTAETIELTMGFESLANEPFPGRSFVPAVVPGMFH